VKLLNKLDLQGFKNLEGLENLKLKTLNFKLKICGMKYAENIRAVAALQPDYMGFIFYEKSKRFVGEELDAELLLSLKNIKKVGVFVDAEKEYIIEKIKKYNLDFIQLHGNETAEFCKELTAPPDLPKGEEIRDGNCEVKLIKAFGVNEKFDFDVLNDYKPYCDYFLFDTKTESFGGSGKSFDWKVLEKYAHEIPFFLSGGIGLEEISNFKFQISNFTPFAIDVNSKFEIEAGLKDVGKLGKLIKNNL